MCFKENCFIGKKKNSFFEIFNVHTSHTIISYFFLLFIIFQARTDLSAQSTPAAATTQEPNIQNVNPNVIHSSSSTTASSVSSRISSPPNSGNNKSQVITQNIHLKNTTSGATAASLKENCSQAESLVVSVPLSATTVPGIQLPTNSSNNTSNSSSVSTIVQMQTTSPMSSVSSSSISTHGSLYQHLTNNQTGSQRASPLVHQQQGGRSSSPLVPTTSSLTLDNSSSNHTSVLQNMNSATSGGSVISSTGFHGNNLSATGSTSTTETSPTMLKVQYEKQPQSRIHAIIQQEESGRRSRYVQLWLFFSSLPSLIITYFFPFIVLFMLSFVNRYCLSFQHAHWIFFSSIILNFISVCIFFEFKFFFYFNSIIIFIFHVFKNHEMIKKFALFLSLSYYILLIIICH